MDSVSAVRAGSSAGSVGVGTVLYVNSIEPVVISMSRSPCRSRRYSTYEAGPRLCPRSDQSAALLLGRPSASVAAFWLVWPLTTATGPCSGSAGAASTTTNATGPTGM